MKAKANSWQSLCVGRCSDLFIINCITSICTASQPLKVKNGYREKAKLIYGLFEKLEVFICVVVILLTQVFVTC